MLRSCYRRVAFAVLALVAGGPTGFPLAAAESPAPPQVTTTVTDLAETPASSTTSSSVGYPDDVFYTFRIGVYSPVPLADLWIRVVWRNRISDPLHCSSLAGTAVIASGDYPDPYYGDFPSNSILFNFGTDALQQSQRILRCSINVWHGDASWAPKVYVYEAHTADGRLIDVTENVCLDCGAADPRGYGPPRSDYDDCRLNLCGDVHADGRWTAADSLTILKAAVGTPPKYRQAYDVDGDASISTSDALMVLRRSVGAAVVLRCDAPPAAHCDAVKL